MSYNFINFNVFDKIFILVSGGIDSTYLYEHFKKRYKNKVFPINCYNPFERNKTLQQIKQNDSNFIEILPANECDYKKILKDSFMNLPKAKRLKDLDDKQKELMKKKDSICKKAKLVKHYHKKFLDVVIS